MHSLDFKIWKVLFVFLIIGAALVLVLLVRKQMDKMDDVNTEINKTESVADIATANRIIKQVQNAYSVAYMNNLAYPTLEQVKVKFECSNVIWEDNYVIETRNFDCKVEIIENKLHVTCLDYETTEDLILSN